MKKSLLLILALIMALSLAACGAGSNSPSGQVNIDKFPDAEQFSEFNWPEFGLSDNIPKPSWSNRGKILCDTEIFFSVEIGYTTKDNFDSYAKKCYEAGYSIDYFNNETVIGDLYSATNKDGYSISVCYRAKNVMSIQLTAPSANSK